MNQQVKYILSIVLGFILVFAIGIAGIKLFKAKRSTAPEADGAAVTNTQPGQPKALTPIQKQVQELRTEQFSLPAEVSSADLAFADLPPVLQSAFKKYAASATVYGVTYDQDKIGFRLEQDVALPMNKLAQQWQDQLVASKQFVSSKNDPAQIIYAAKIENYKVLLTFSQLTGISAGQTIRVVVETNE